MVLLLLLRAEGARVETAVGAWHAVRSSAGPGNYCGIFLAVSRSGSIDFRGEIDERIACGDGVGVARPKLRPGRMRKAVPALPFPSKLSRVGQASPSARHA